MTTTFKNLITRMGDNYYKWGFSFLPKLLLIITLTVLSADIHAQAREVESSKSSNTNKKKGFDPKRLVFGGSLGGTFGNVTYFEVSPRVGYLLTDSWIAGVAGKYAYYEENTPFFDYSTSMYGGGVYTQYFFLRYFVAHVEYEMLNLEDFRPPFERVNIHSFFVGGGISSRIGGSNSFFNAILLYNLNETYNSPYSNPYLQIGFGIGL